VLVKILKHVDSDTRKQKSMYKSHNKVKQAGLNKSLLALRKLMMEIELNVNSTSNFFIEETEQEITQNLFIRALSLVDKLILGSKRSQTSKSQTKVPVIEDSTNKSNSEWDTKSVS